VDKVLIENVLCLSNLAQDSRKRNEKQNEPLLMCPKSASHRIGRPVL